MKEGGSCPGDSVMLVVVVVVAVAVQNNRNVVVADGNYWKCSGSGGR